MICCEPVAGCQSQRAGFLSTLGHCTRTHRLWRARIPSAGWGLPSRSEILCVTRSGEKLFISSDSRLTTAGFLENIKRHHLEHGMSAGIVFDDSYVDTS